MIYIWVIEFYLVLKNKIMLYFRNIIIIGVYYINGIKLGLKGKYYVFFFMCVF